MPAGAARNAVDCALWDLEAKLAGTSAWAMCARTPPERILTAYSLGIDTPSAMAEAAGAAQRAPLIKIKLAGDGADIERMDAVRGARPDARIIVDANEALDLERLAQVLAAARRIGIEMIEQPLPAGDDEALADIERVVPICADEACQTSSDVAGLVGRYDMVNIKLDKTGGLTEALRLEAATRAAGLKVMVGCMFSTSLGIAPAQIVAANADCVDLDATLHLAADRDHPIGIHGCAMKIASPALWG